MEQVNLNGNKTLLEYLNMVTNTDDYVDAALTSLVKEKQCDPNRRHSDSDSHCLFLESFLSLSEGGEMIVIGQTVTCIWLVCFPMRRRSRRYKPWSQSTQETLDPLFKPLYPTCWWSLWTTADYLDQVFSQWKAKWHFLRWGWNEGRQREAVRSILWWHVLYLIQDQQWVVQQHVKSTRARSLRLSWEHGTYKQKYSHVGSLYSWNHSNKASDLMIVSMTECQRFIHRAGG